MNNLKTLRNQFGYNQREMASLLNLAKATYARYETGETEPDFQTLFKIANYFNCSIDYLLGHQTQGILHLDSLTQAQRKLVELIQKLNNDQALIAIGYFSEMLNLPYSEVKPVNKPF
mgnify:CR=1 FL=1